MVDLTRFGNIFVLQPLENISEFGQSGNKNLHPKLIDLRGVNWYTSGFDSSYVVHTSEGS